MQVPSGHTVLLPAFCSVETNADRSCRPSIGCVPQFSPARSELSSQAPNATVSSVAVGGVVKSNTTTGVTAGTRYIPD